VVPWHRLYVRFEDAAIGSWMITVGAVKCPTQTRKNSVGRQQESGRDITDNCF
jgi:hypothetical protein